MRLVPKKKYFIYQLQCDHLQSISVVPAHNFSSGTAIVCSIHGTHLVGCRIQARVTAFWMSSVDSKWCPFTADFAFRIKNKSRGTRSGE